METWGTVQVVAGIALFFLLLFGSREGKIPLLLGLLMIVVSVLQRFLLTPEIASLGRALDFLPDSASGGERSRLRLFEGGYLLVEAVKWGLGLLLAVIVGRRRRRSRNARKDLDLIDKSDHRHVNR
jgi:hypothetical protein